MYLVIWYTNIWGVVIPCLWSQTTFAVPLAMQTKLPDIEPLEREQRLYERVAERIYGMVQDETWRSGDRLPPERDLAEAFGVSRTVVREAIKVLEARGVLETQTGSGVYVGRPDLSIVARSLQTYLQLLGQDNIDLRMVEIRRVLEVEIAALAALRATPEQRRELVRLCEEMRKNRRAPRVLAEMDFELHLLLAEAAQNELFVVLLAPLVEQLRGHFIYAWERYGSRPLEAIFSQHEAIVDAVACGEPERARQAMVEHVAYYTGIVQERLEMRTT